MSLGYAQRLKKQEDYGGTLGDKEIFDSTDILKTKKQKLVDMVKESKYIVAMTGAGISTASGIPDFRGPNGVWTCEKAKKPLPNAACSMEHAQPSLTHQVLLGLVKMDKLKYIISQNVDCLHVRSGVPRKQLAELHGNVFCEKCPKCEQEYIRDFELSTVGFKTTGRSCTAPGCRGRLRDSVLDWESPLPEEELQEAEAHLDSADLVLCLGTSLVITPACNLPLRVKKATPKREGKGGIGIVNLQKTPVDKHADVRIFARVDEVMAEVAKGLDMPVPPYRRTDSVIVGHCQGAPSRPRPSQGLESGKQDAKEESVEYRLFVESVHGPACKLVMVQLVEVSVEGQRHELDKAPFKFPLKGTAPSTVVADVVLHLVEAADEDKRVVKLRYDIPLLPASQYQGELKKQRLAGSSEDGLCWRKQFNFLTQVRDFDGAGASLGNSTAPAQTGNGDGSHDPVGAQTGNASGPTGASGPSSSNALAFGGNAVTPPGSGGVSTARGGASTVKRSAATSNDSALTGRQTKVRRT